MEQIQAVIVACNVFFNCVLHGNTHVLAPAICTLKTNKTKHPTTAQKNPGYAAQQKCLYPSRSCLLHMLKQAVLHTHYSQR